MYSQFRLRMFFLCMVFLLWPMSSFSAGSCEETTGRLTRVFRKATRLVPFVGTKSVRAETRFVELDLGLSVGEANRVGNVLKDWTLGDLQRTPREVLESDIGKEITAKIEPVLWKKYNVKLISVVKSDIKELGLSSVIVDLLKFGGKNTVQDLVNTSEKDLLTLPAMSDHIEKIKDALAVYGLELKDDSAEEGPGLVVRTAQTASRTTMRGVRQVGHGITEGVRGTGRLASLVGNKAVSVVPFIGKNNQEIPETPITNLELGLSLGDAKSVNSVLEAMKVSTLLDISGVKREFLEDLIGADLFPKVEQALLRNYGVRLTSLADSDISELGLDSDIVEILRFGGKNTVRDLMNTPKEDLLKMPTITEVSIQQINEALEEYTRLLDDAGEEVGFMSKVAKRAGRTASAAKRRVGQAAGGIVRTGSAVVRTGVHFVPSGIFTKSSVDLSIPVADLNLVGLSVGTVQRIKNIFENLNIKTLGDLLNHSLEDLYATSIGETVVDQLAATLKRTYKVQLMSIQEFSVERLELPEQLTQTLIASGVDTLGVLREFSKNELLNHFEIKEEDGNKIEEAMAKLNLRLAQSDSNTASSQTADSQAPAETTQKQPGPVATAETTQTSAAPEGETSSAKTPEETTQQPPAPPAETSSGQARTEQSPKAPAETRQPTAASPKAPVATTQKQPEPAATAPVQITLETPVSEIDFGLVGVTNTRVKKALEQKGIEFAGDFQNYTREDLEALPGLGQRTVDRIENVLGQSGISLKVQITLETPVSEIDFGLVGVTNTRVKKALEQADIKVAGDFQNYTRADLEALPGLGQRTVDRIENVLNPHGISLKVQIVLETPVSEINFGFKSEHDSVDFKNALDNANNLRIGGSYPSLQVAGDFRNYTRQRLSEVPIELRTTLEASFAGVNPLSQASNWRRLRDKPEILNRVVELLAQNGISLKEAEQPPAELPKAPVETVQTQTNTEQPPAAQGETSSASAETTQPPAELPKAPVEPAQTQAKTEQPSATASAETTMSLGQFTFETPVSEIDFGFTGGFNTRIKNALERAGIKIAGDFQEYTREDLEDFLRVSSRTMDNIERVLFSNGISLKKEEGTSTGEAGTTANS